MQFVLVLTERGPQGEGVRVTRGALCVHEGRLKFPSGLGGLERGFLSSLSGPPQAGYKARLIGLVHPQCTGQDVLCGPTDSGLWIVDMSNGYVGAQKSEKYSP